MTARIVGLMGRMGSGKDTFGAHLIAKGYTRVAFGEGIYREAAQGMQTTVEALGARATKEMPQASLCLARCIETEFVEVALAQLGASRSVRQALKHPGKVSRRRLKRWLQKPLSPRQVLQWWGSEYRRARYGQDYWIRQLTERMAKAPGATFVVTDVRLMSEVQALKALDAHLLRVVRPSQGGVTDTTLLHPTERELLSFKEDLTIQNLEGQLTLLASQADAYLAHGLNLPRAA